MKINKTLYVTNKDAWRSWLIKNSKTKKEIWLVYYRKFSGKKRIHYNDAVDEALCFGWIDSTVKSIDKEKFAQRFTPRRKGSNLSEMNKERVRRLIKQKRMTPEGLNAINHTFNHLEDKKTRFVIKKDILMVLRKNKVAWKNFKKFPEGYKRIRIGYIEGEREYSKVEFNRRLNYLIKMTEKNKRFGLIRD